MNTPSARGNAEALAAIAAITGQSARSADEMFCAIVESQHDPTPAEHKDISKAVDMLCTRLGLAPALSQTERDHYTRDLRALGGKLLALTRADLSIWAAILRSVPEKIPTIEREPEALPAMPVQQEAMWATLLDFEETNPPPWVLVGGQMTALHLIEHGITVHRPTDDGDIVVGVWTRRDALRTTTFYLANNGFTESRTHDGCGYRFVRGKTTIDVMIPDGFDRQQRYLKTDSGRPGLQADGGNQALTRAERVPINLDGRVGHVRRPTLLGSLVTKAHAAIIDRRHPERHTQDLIALSELGLLDPRTVISQARPDDRRAIRRILRRLPADHRLLRTAEDPTGVHAFLTRLARPPDG